MRLTGWLKRRQSEAERRRGEWRGAWSTALESEDGQRLDELRERLPALEGHGSDIEIELEMLDALERLVRLRGDLGAGALPVVETHHRVIGGERCHFAAPASLPADPAQPSGRVLFTPSRALFVGSGKSTAVAWHAVPHIVRQERDLVLARADATGGAHFRFNTYADAVVAGFLARRLRGARPDRVL
jgi:hypothetical protein